MKYKFIALWSVGTVCTAIALPYIFALQKEQLDKLNVPYWQIGLGAVVQTAILLVIVVYFGLLLAKRINLPIFDQKSLSKENIKNVFKVGIPIGFVVAGLIKLADVFFIKQIPNLAETVAQIAFWKNISASFYGGVVEELLMRLFFVSFIAWAIGKMLHAKDIVKNNTVMWLSIIIASVLFGLGHLPVTATLTPITTLVVVRAILLNGIGGMVFGYLYWKKGLEYAIVAHFFTDIFLIAVIPAVLGLV